MKKGTDMKAYKGFDKDLKCRGYQYEIGKEYQQDGNIVTCANGFHACEDPLEVFAYYPPATSRYCEVEQSGVIAKDNSDSKVASSKIKIDAEIGIPGLVKAKIEYVNAHTTTEYTDLERATAGEYGAATAGEYGAATAGNRGAATAGNRGAATSRGSVSVGENGCGLARGNNVKARGGLGAILVMCEENADDYNVKDWGAVIVDGVTVKADTWYTLKDGEIVEVN